MNELPTTQERLKALEGRFDRFEILFQRCTGVPMDAEQGVNVVSLNNKIITIPLLSEIEGIEDYEIALETLNQAGNSRGVEFKKGIQKQNKGEKPYERSIICKFADRNREKHTINKKNPSQPTEKTLIKDINCPVIYKFAITNGKISLKKAVEDHNHTPFINLQKKLTPLMISDIENYPKNSCIADIKDFLENKYSAKIDYMSIYHQFRLFNPKFGPDDCQNFLNYLMSEGAVFRNIVSAQNKSLTRIIFSTKLMKNNYLKHGEVLLCDTTYNTNYYSAPLVVFSGVDGNYKNILFAIGIINEEKASTYEWLFQQFIEMMDDKRPNLVVSDMDHALTSAIKTTLPAASHRLCAWHLSRNLRRNFGYISQDYEDLKKKILDLPYCYSKFQFDSAVNEIEKYFKSEKLEKFQRYLSSLLGKKQQWARSYYPCIFDADISTTSRVESWNASLKRYLHSRSGLSDIIEFISETEKCYFYKELNISKGEISLLEYDSLLKSLKEILPPKIYNKHLTQYALGRRDYVRLNPENKSEFKIQFQNNQAKDDVFVNEVDINSQNTIYTITHGEKIDCDCTHFQTTGMVCRHVFFFCVTENIKDISKLRISDRWIVSLEESEKHFIVLPEVKKKSDAQEPKDSADIMEIVMEKDEENNIFGRDRSQLQRINLQVEKNVLSKVENMEKVVAKKGAPRGSRKRKTEDNSSKIERLTEEIKRLKAELDEITPQNKNESLIRITLPKNKSSAKRRQHEETEDEREEEEQEEEEEGDFVDDGEDEAEAEEKSSQRGKKIVKGILKKSNMVQEDQEERGSSTKRSKGASKSRRSEHEEESEEGSPLKEQTKRIVKGTIKSKIQSNK